MKTLALTIGGKSINPPAGVPTGGLGPGGNGTNAINLAINLIFIVGLVLAIIFILYSGVQWVMSGGDKEKIQKARARLTYSIVGLVIIVASFAIINIVITLLGGSPGFFLHTTP